MKLAHLILLFAVLAITSVKANPKLRLSRERMVFQTDHGSIHMAFYPDVAPITVAHLIKLGDLGAYNSVDFFRVDAGFVAQVSEITSAREVPLDPVQRAEAEKRVPLEVRADVKHDKRGILSMARSDDPNSGGSSFSILLGAAPHLDMQYAIFGEVTKGIEALASMERVETKRDGIFVMPLERITIRSTYMYVVDDTEGEQIQCLDALSALQSRYDLQSVKMQKEREKHNLPGN
jgi:cyclophilin family peptidyl-prolyl cis-trans isomerase